MRCAWPARAQHAQNCAAEKTGILEQVFNFMAIITGDQLILALESTYELLYMHQLPCFQISAPSPEPAAHMMQTPTHSHTQLSKRMAARGKRTLITPLHRRAAPWCAPELGAKNRTGKLKINYSGTGMEGGSWLSGGHWGQRREKKGGCWAGRRKGKAQGCWLKYIHNSLHQALYARAWAMSLFWSLYRWNCWFNKLAALLRSFCVVMHILTLSEEPLFDTSNWNLYIFTKLLIFLGG